MRLIFFVVMLSFLVVIGLSFDAYADAQSNQLGSLQIQKRVINGGSTNPEDFSFNLEIVYPNGTYTKQVMQFSHYGNYVNDLPRGTVYKVTENPYPYYDTSYGNECSGIVGIVNYDFYCVIENKPRQWNYEGLEIEKVVINDNGGTKKPQDFTFDLQVEYPNGTRQVIQFHPYVDGWYTNEGIPLGTKYKVTEEPLSGYNTRYSGECFGIVKADSYCRIENDDVNPSTLPASQLDQYPGDLTVSKRVINDNGGTKKPQDFSFNLEIVFPNGTYTKQLMQFSEHWAYAGFWPRGTLFKLTEIPSPDYDTSYWNECSGTVGTITDEFYCVVVNNDKPVSTQTTHASIPSWIKNNAKWWSNGSVSDREFVTSIGYLVQQKIISTSVATNTDGTILVNDNLNIPTWVKNNAKWWSDGTIADTDFTSGIEYMINQNIISFSEHSKKQGTTSKDTAKSPNAKNKQNETESILDQIPEPTLQELFGGTSQNKTHVTPNQTTGNTIEIQSKHGSYEQISDKSYLLYPSWVLASNGVYRTTTISETGPDGSRNPWRINIEDGVIHQEFPVDKPGTYVFEILSIDGHPPPANSRIEITIPQNTSPETTSTVPSTGTPITYSLDFSVPSQIVQEATSSAGAIVQFNTQFSSPGVGGSVIITCNPPSGSQFPIGNTVVTCTATDLQSQKTLQKTFTVTVRDTTPPAIAPFQPVTGATDDLGAIVYFTISATDLVDGPVTPHCDHASGDKFPIGVSTITCTADDSRGNHASRTLQITITKS